MLSRHDVAIRQNQMETEIRRYFEQRRKGRNIVKTTQTPQGRVVDWIPIASQGKIASPPPTESGKDAAPSSLVAELDHKDAERGPEGTVPILRRDLSKMRFNKPLGSYLSKTGGSMRGMSHIVGREKEVRAADETAVHRYGSSQQAVNCYGGQGNISYWDPYTENGDFSLLQIGMLSSNDASKVETVEAGWQVYPELTGDAAAHLFTYFTTNGYSQTGNNLGGYDTDVNGWVQYDSSIFPGTTFSPVSANGGTQTQLPIKYQLYQGNWWLSCVNRWVGYYPGSLFQSGGTLADHADHIGFWGEVFDSTEVAGRTTTDMGSGQFPSTGWQHSAYLSNLKYQADTGATNFVDYDGSAAIVQEDTDMYQIEPHFGNTGSSWGSYAWVGGPGTG